MDLRRGLIITTAVVVIAGGIGLGLLRFSNAEPYESGFEGALGSFALGALIAAPGLLALLSLRRRPALLLPAALALLPVTILSFVTLPLVFAAAIFLFAYVRSDDGMRPSTVGVVVTVTGGLVAALVVLLFGHQDPRSYTTATGGGSTSDIITWGESIASLALVAAATVAGWFLAASRP